MVVYIWIEIFCKIDFDGDGKINGEELGDFVCIWNVGDRLVGSVFGYFGM